MANVHFWNGNKSPIRQGYELALLRQVLDASASIFSGFPVIEDKTDYPDAKDEGAVFKKGADVCVTVAGNPKFANGDYLAVEFPLMLGYLGHRLLVIRDSDKVEFAQISNAQQLQQKTIGIPATWADANLFRDNGYKVRERGSLDNLFQRLKQGECDYVALGANEIFSIFDELAARMGGLTIEPNLRLYYPFALVFYVTPSKPKLAQALQRGLDQLQCNGDLRRLFLHFNQETLQQSALLNRKVIQLNNSTLPRSMAAKMEQTQQQLIQIAQAVNY